MTSIDSSTDEPTDFSGLDEPQRVSGGEGELGHMDELRTDPISLFWRVRQECGDLGVFRIADRDICLASGAAANEAFFRAPDEARDQAAAARPAHGPGVPAGPGRGRAGVAAAPGRMMRTPRAVTGPDTTSKG